MCVDKTPEDKYKYIWFTMGTACFALATLVMTEVILVIDKLIGGNQYIAKALSMLLTIVFNYILSKLFIFKRKGTQNENKEI